MHCCTAATPAFGTSKKRLASDVEGTTFDRAFMSDPRPPEHPQWQNSEDRFRLLVESVRDYALIMLDPEGRIVSWNAGAERIKGYKPEEILGSHFSRFYPPEDVAAGKPERELVEA